MRFFNFLFIGLLFSTSLLASAASGASITLNSSGESSYQLIGNEFSNVAGLTVKITYDTSILESPRITPGALAKGTVFVANPDNNRTGEVTIALVSSPGVVSGSGSLAEITFTRKGSSGGGITGITAPQVIDPNRKALPVSAGLGNLSGATTAFANAPSSQSTESGGTTTIIPGSQPSGTGTAAYPGAVTLAVNAEPTHEKQAKESSETPVAPPTPTPPTEIARQESVPESITPAVKPEKRTLPAPPANVLELFRTYKGEPTLKSLKKLFVARGGEWIAQEPPVAPADGKTVITLQLATEIFTEKAPNFSLSGLEMKRVKPAENGWAIEVVPLKDSLKSSISIVVDGNVSEVQIIAVPALPKVWDKVKLSEAEVNRFLADKSVGKASRNDLNGDGKHDYKDDYIMVGNYLLHNPKAGLEKAEKPKEAGKSAK
jgi:hypothetical protein